MTINTLIEQQVEITDTIDAKFKSLWNVLVSNQTEHKKFIVFLRTKHGVKKMVKTITAEARERKFKCVIHSL